MKDNKKDQPKQPHQEEKQKKMENEMPPVEKELTEDTEKLEQLSAKQLEAKLNEAEAKANENWDKFLRVQAELENMRRRMERDVTNAHKYGLEKFITELLAVVDSLELGISELSSSKEANLKHTRDGMEMTLSMLLKVLQKHGVQQVNPQGEVFNPAWHQAISTKEDKEAKPNTVVEVLQKGYVLQDRLLRPALVVVAKP